MLGADLRRRLWLIFGLGALQGAVGWWMVASGLSQRVEVSHYRLATHLVLALLIFAGIVWTLRRMGARAPSAASARLKITAVALLVLTFVQLYLGALVAGLRAGKIYNTWPEIDGGLIPVRGATFLRDAVVAQPVRQHVDGSIRTSHGRLRAVRDGSSACSRRGALAGRSSTINGAVWLAGVVTLQATLGILTLLNQVPMDLALAHQAVAIAVLTLAVFQVERLAGRQREQTPHEMVRPVAQTG